MSGSFGLFDELEFETTLKNEFLAEARELLTDVEPCFLKYEKDPSSEKEMAQIFRLVHTFKGSAGVAGFKGLATFAHNFETLLSRLRAGEIDPDAQIIEILFKGNDALKGYVECLEHDHHAAFDTSEVDAMLFKVFNRGKGEEAAPPPRQPVPSRPPPVNSHNQGKKILVVDDEPILRSCVNAILSAEGYTVIEAENGQLALAIIQNDPEIKLLLTDQSMPVMSGEQLVESLRELHISIPTIVITGVSNQKAAAKFIRSGVYLYLTKPVDADDLILSVRNALKSAEMAEALSQVLAVTFRNYLKLRRLAGSESGERLIDNDITVEMKSMGELISKVLNRD